MQKCNLCQQEKPFSEFYKSNGGFRKRCKSCIAAQQKEKYAKKVGRAVKLVTPLKDILEKGIRACARCGESKQLADFHRTKCKNSHLGFRYATVCRVCSNAYCREYGSANKERRNKRLREWRKVADREMVKAMDRRSAVRRTIKYKQLAIDVYGGKCANCGVAHSAVLTLDHVNNDGNEHRKQISENRLFLWACKNGFPDSLQLLCYNCNIGKHHNRGTLLNPYEGVSVQEFYRRLGEPCVQNEADASKEGEPCHADILLEMANENEEEK